jgi:hypothetical protein
MNAELKAIFKRYGTQAEVARAFKVTPASVLKWRRAGCLPLLRQYQWREMRQGSRSA